jgi:serine/threonine protein phosphatase PrpC
MHQDESSNMSSTDLAKSTHEENRWAAHAAISIVSPGKDEEEEKNQDRLLLMETTDSKNTKCQLAIVCDGVTSSPNGAAAAEYISDQVHALFQEGGLERTVEALKEMRLALLEKPLKMENGQSALLRSMFEEIVRQKYQHSYQSTFAAVCLKRDETNSPGMISIKALGCGDAALFIFRENGELHYNNVNLDNELDRFRHSSPFTAVLPDCYDRETNNVLFDFKEYPEDVHLLLCSDGLYDGFTNFKEIRDWLHEHRAELMDSALAEKCLSELHNRLNQKKGDDDISFIWLHPNGMQPATQQEVEESEEENRHAEDSKSGRQGFFAGLFAAVSRWVRL